MRNAILIILLNLHGFYSLNNGVAQLPPMGWSSWQAFGCTSCTSSNDLKCLSDASIKNVAKQMQDEGYFGVGYTYIILDDCWQSKQRTRDGKLQADPQRFPNGIATLANEIHNGNMRLGILGDVGRRTGSGGPGSESNYATDARTFAEWGVDYVKMSAASVSDATTLDRKYPEFGSELRKAQRPMVYATSWPVYQYVKNVQVFHESLPLHCNTWRFGFDMIPKWSRILQVMDQYKQRQSELIRITGQGAWSDADLLMAGQEGVTLDQSKAQMAVWAIMPSPLIFSADISSIKPEFKALLQNRGVIAVNQDDLRLPGSFIRTIGNIDIWVKRIGPVAGTDYSYALAFVNRSSEGAAVDHRVTLSDLGLNRAAGYTITDLFDTTATGTTTPPSATQSGTTPPTPQQLQPNSVLQMRINPSGVMFYKAEIIT